MQPQTAPVLQWQPSLKTFKKIRHQDRVHIKSEKKKQKKEDPKTQTYKTKVRTDVKKSKSQKSSNADSLFCVGFIQIQVVSEV